MFHHHFMIAKLRYKKLSINNTDIAMIRVLIYLSCFRRHRGGWWACNPWLPESIMGCTQQISPLSSNFPPIFRVFSPLSLSFGLRGFRYRSKTSRFLHHFLQDLETYFLMNGVYHGIIQYLFLLWSRLLLSQWNPRFHQACLQALLTIVLEQGL